MKSETSKVQIGRAYFFCGYYLRNVPIPEIETWIYIGENIFEEDQDAEKKYHYFKRPEVYFEKEIEKEYSQYQVEDDAQANQSTERHPLIRVSEEDLDGLVYDYRELCDWVSRLGQEPNAEKYF